MVNPIAKLEPNKKLGPLPRKYWMLLGGGLIVGTLYFRHRSKMAQVAGPTDPTVAGSTQDAQGNQVQTNGTATDAGTTPMSAYDPYTSGYNGYGYNVVLGAGGIVRPVGQNGTDAGNVVPPGTPAANPASPGSVFSGPQQVTVNYQRPERTRVIEPASPAQRATTHRKVREGAHNMKNGRGHKNHRKVKKHEPEAQFNGGVPING